MKVYLTFLISALATLSACGKQNDSRSRITDSSGIPTAAIIAVRDADSLNSEFTTDDFRTVISSPLATSLEKIQDQDLPMIHKEAQQAETIQTQSQVLVVHPKLRGWLHYRRCPSQVLRVSYEAQQEPLLLDSCQTYQRYQPVYMVKGKAHRFFYQRAYRLQNVTYFFYVNEKQNIDAPSQSTEQSVDQSHGKKEQVQEKASEQKPEVRKQQEIKSCQKEEQAEQIVKPTNC